MKKIFLILLIIFNLTNCAEQNPPEEYYLQFEPGQEIYIHNKTDVLMDVYLCDCLVGGYWLKPHTSIKVELWNENIPKAIAAVNVRGKGGCVYSQKLEIGRSYVFVQNGKMFYLLKQ